MTGRLIYKLFGITAHVFSGRWAVIFALEKFLVSINFHHISRVLMK